MPSTPRRAAIAVAAVLSAVTLTACSSGDGARKDRGHLPVPLTRRPNRDYLRKGGTCPAAGLLRPVADGGG